MVVYLPVLIEHAALIMATINEMRKTDWRDQLNPIEVIFVVAADGCATTLLFLFWPTANIIVAAAAAAADNAFSRNHSHAVM